MFYKFALAVINIVLRLIFRVSGTGYENVPETGGVIVAFNHRSNWDPVIAGMTCPRRLRFMAKEELFKNPFFGGLIKSLGAFPVSRGRGDIGAVKAALKILSSNEAMLMFPEGHRVRDGELAPVKPGIAAIANRAGVPIVPARISGEYKWRRTITVTYGKPVYISYEKKKDAGELQAIADSVMDTIRKMG